jgi:hypothetical protein
LRVFVELDAPRRLDDIRDRPGDDERRRRIGNTSDAAGRALYAP